MPAVIRGKLTHWVNDNVDALVRAFASDDDAVVVAADEGAVVDDGEGSSSNGTNSLSGSNSGDGASDMSD